MRRRLGAAAVLAASLAAPVGADVTATSCTVTITDAGYYESSACTYVSRDLSSAASLTRQLTLSVSDGYAMATLNCDGVDPAVVLLGYDYDPPKAAGRLGAGYCTLVVRGIDYSGGTTTATAVAW